MFNFCVLLGAWALKVVEAHSHLACVALRKRSDDGAQVGSSAQAMFFINIPFCHTGYSWLSRLSHFSLGNLQLFFG